jgi:hypothetical protein
MIKVSRSLTPNNTREIRGACGEENEKRCVRNLAKKDKGALRD